MWKRTGECNKPVFVGWLFLMSLFAALSFVGCQAQAGWGPRGCAPVGAPVYIQQPQYVASLQWHYPADWEKSGQASLYRGNAYQGSYDYFTGIYTPADGSKPYHPEGWQVWGVGKQGCQCKKCEGICKCGKTRCCGDKGCRCCCSEAEPEVMVTQNFGIDVDKVQSDRPRYFISDARGGREITKQSATQVLEKNLEDDSNKYRLSVVGGTSEQRSKVFGDLYSNPSLTWLKEKTLVQAYPDAKHHHLDGFKLDQDERFKKSGFMIALQNPAGKVLHAQYDYDDGAEGLSLGARRRIDPNFDPNKNADGRKAPALPEVPLEVPGWLWLAGGGVIALAIVLLPNRKAVQL